MGGLCGLAVIGGIEALALPKLVPALLWLPLWGRIVVAIVLIAPLGLAMGMPFPSGLRRTGDGSLAAPPFYWGLNGIMSVIGSVTTVFVALTAGFQAAMLMGSACYLLAALASRMALRRRLKAPARVSSATTQAICLMAGRVERNSRRFAAI